MTVARTGKTKEKSMTSLTKKYTAAGLIAQFGNLVLLGKRSSKCHNLSGNWSMPCGMIESGEDPKAAAKREFLEETGVKANDQVDFLEDFEMSDGNFFALYSMKIEDLIFPSTEAVDAIEHDEWGFFKLEKNSLPMPMTKEARKAILKLK
jgi:8-oxo-dGTP pyrophosphatase MutT (NUDIX family)